MRTACFLGLVVALAAPAQAADTAFPIGKGTVKPFVMDVPDGWTVTPGRARGDRWMLRERKSGRPVGRIDYRLAHTDQKMQPLVLEEQLRLGELDVDKASVSPAVPMAAEQPVRITRSMPLVTSWRVSSGPLEGLLVMSDVYTRASGLEAKVERMLSTARLR